SYEASRKYQYADDGASIVWRKRGWSGSQRIPVQAACDVQRDWEGLAACVRGALSTGMSGVPFQAIDVGGAYGSEPLTAELFIRWLQASVFASHVRLARNGACEPWTFGDEIEAIARRWLEFRYRLLPYLNSVAVQSTRNGLPVMRAMPLAFPSNA